VQFLMDTILNPVIVQFLMKKWRSFDCHAFKSW
jgi:hypothetical protein